MTSQTIVNAGTYLAEALGVGHRDGIDMVERVVALFAAGESPVDILQRLNPPARPAPAVERDVVHDTRTALESVAAYDGRVSGEQFARGLTTLGRAGHGPRR